MRGTRPRHARRRRPIRTRRSALIGLAVGPLALASWLGLGAVGNAAANTAFVATTIVRPGDTLSAIAMRYGTTVAALAAANGISDPNRIRAGIVLHVPDPASTPHAPPPAPPPPAAAPAPPLPSTNTVPPITVTVRTGDTLSSIALRYHTTVAALVSVNKITNPNLVLAGSRLALTEPSLPPGWEPGGPLPPAVIARPDRMALRQDFLQAANASAVAPNLLEALCWWESGWTSTATSSSGAIGLCQLEPSTVNFARSVLLGEPNLDPRVASDNIAMAAAYLHNLTVRAGGNVRLAVAAYYQGLSSVQGNGLLPSTQTYVTGIFNYAAVFAAAG